MIPMEPIVIIAIIATTAPVFNLRLLLYLRKVDQAFHLFMITNYIITINPTYEKKIF